MGVGCAVGWSRAVDAGLDSKLRLSVQQYTRWKAHRSSAFGRLTASSKATRSEPEAECRCGSALPATAPWRIPYSHMTDAGYTLSPAQSTERLSPSEFQRKAAQRCRSLAVGRSVRGFRFVRFMRGGFPAAASCFTPASHGWRVGLFSPVIMARAHRRPFSEASPYTEKRKTGPYRV